MFLRLSHKSYEGSLVTRKATTGGSSRRNIVCGLPISVQQSQLFHQGRRRRLHRPVRRVRVRQQKLTQHSLQGNSPFRYRFYSVLYASYVFRIDLLLTDTGSGYLLPLPSPASTSQTRKQVSDMLSQNRNRLLLSPHVVSIACEIMCNVPLTYWPAFLPSKGFFVPGGRNDVTCVK